MEAGQLILDKLDQYRDSFEPKSSWTEEAAADLKSVHDLPRELKQHWSPELKEQLEQSLPEMTPELKAELEQLMEKPQEELLMELGRVEINPFPSDDISTLQQLASGDYDLSSYYEWQFVQSEEVMGEDIEPEGCPRNEKMYQLDHFPTLQGTVTGTVYDGDMAVQTFVVKESGQFSWTDIGHPKRRVAIAKIDHELGEIEATWSHSIGEENKIVVNYEYNYPEDGRLPNDTRS